jgi:hypothetical protein
LGGLLFGDCHNPEELRLSFLIEKNDFVIICANAAVPADRKFFQLDRIE